MNIGKMLKQAQKMQSDMAKVQEELASRQIEVSVGGGKVTVTGNGAGEILSIRIDPSVVDPSDVEMLEDLVLSGVKNAVEQGKAMTHEEMAKLTQGLGLPPGMGLPGMGL